MTVWQLNALLSRRTLLTAAAAACVLPTTRPAANAKSKRPVPGVSALQLATVSGGAGPPALFIHGFGSSKYTWRRVCAGLQDTFSYRAIDLPGHGESAAPADFDFSIENLSDVLARYIESHDFKNLTVVASSLGATVTLLAMLRNATSLSQRVSSLCIIDGACYPQIERCGHLPQEERPDDVVALMRGFYKPA